MLADEALETHPRRSGGNWETEWQQEERKVIWGSSVPELATGDRVSRCSVSRLECAGILMSDDSLLTYV